LTFELEEDVMMALHRHHMRSALARVDHLIQAPWSISRLVDVLGDYRGRLIQIVPWDICHGDDAPSGLCVPSAHADYIFYDRSASPTQREQIIGHEIGHLLLNHTRRLEDAPDELLAALTPSLRPELVRRFLARGGYQVDEEAAAEEFGTRLVRLGRSKQRPSESGELGRLTEALR